MKMSEEIFNDLYKERRDKIYDDFKISMLMMNDPDYKLSDDQKEKLRLLDERFDYRSGSSHKISSIRLFKMIVSDYMITGEDSKDVSLREAKVFIDFMEDLLKEVSYQKENKTWESLVVLFRILDVVESFPLSPDQKIDVRQTIQALINHIVRFHFSIPTISDAD